MVRHLFTLLVKYSTGNIIYKCKNTFLHENNLKFNEIFEGYSTNFS